MYSTKVVGNITIPRLWQGYSPLLKKPYCEVCWLFSERDAEGQKAWINGVQVHINVAAAYGRWKAGKQSTRMRNKMMKKNITFWNKVLQRFVAIILTICTFNLSLRGHRNSVHDVRSVDQLSDVVRRVNVNCEPVETFLGFVEVTSPDAQGLRATTISFFEGMGTSLLKLCGQGYDCEWCVRWCAR